MSNQIFLFINENSQEALYDEALNLKASSQFNQVNYFYGKMPWPIQSMLRLIIEVKLDINQDKYNNIGQVISYLNIISMDQPTELYQGILIDTREAYLFKSHHGIII